MCTHKRLGAQLFSDRSFLDMLVTLRQQRTKRAASPFWTPVLGGRLDEAARSIHEAYYRRQIAAGKKQGETPAIMPWENLPAGIRQANRSQADRIPIKRRMLEISRTEETIGSLAESEHRRWVAERTWRSGDTQPRGTMLAAAFSSFAPTRNSGRRSGRRTATR